MKDQFEAFQFSMENHFVPALTGYDSHKWRMERYYNEQVDNFLQAYLPLLDGVYKTWAKQKGPRKKDVWMVYDEYNSFVTSFVDTNEYPVRDNPLLFNISLRLQVSEIIGDKHINMFFPEFLEAMCRAVDKASPAPPGEKVEDWPMQKRVDQLLIRKLENIINSIIHTINHPDFKNVKEKFPSPIKDPSTDLYIIDSENNNFYQNYPINPTYSSISSRKGTKINTVTQNSKKT